MRTSNGQSVRQNSNPVNASVDTRPVSKIEKSLLPAQAEFIDFIMFHGIAELPKSLKLIHDLARYHSDVSFNENEKSALFDLKILWEDFEQMEKEL